MLRKYNTKGELVTTDSKALAVLESLSGHLQTLDDRLETVEETNRELIEVIREATER